MPGSTSLPGDDVCGNQESLTNLLVYQYLSGSIPENGDTPEQLVSNVPVSLPTISITTSLSTSLTTLVKTLEASTHYSTSTTSYVTTITSVGTTVMPVHFRGSKVITTITSSNEEVITATEFFTSSSVVASSIVQTLPVEITLSITKTKGVNGDFTLADVNRGASTVLDQPITTATLDLNAAAGLDVSNLNLAGIDLTSLTSLISNQGSPQNDQADVLAQLTALLGGEDSSTSSRPRDDENLNTRFSLQGPTKQKNNFDNIRRSRFHTNSSPNPRNPFTQHPQAPRSQTLQADDTSSKVSPGFRHRDKPAPPRNTNSGSAIQNTRFSKFHKRPSPSDNVQKPRDPPADRERQRFSASENRQAFSKAGSFHAKSTRSGRRVPDSSRFEPALEVNYFEDENKFTRFGPREDRNIATTTRRPVQRPRQNPKPHREVQKSSFRTGIFKPRKPSANSPIIPARASFRHSAPRRPVTPLRVVTPNRSTNPKIPLPPKRLPTPKRPTTPIRPTTSKIPTSQKSNANIPQLTPGKTTKLFTMYLPGTNGETITTVRTVTLRNLQTRYRREATSVNDATEIIDATTTYQMPVETEKPSFNKTPKPKEVITMLKKLDPKSVKEMLKSLQKWVDYYSKELIEPEEDPMTTLKSSMESTQSESFNTATIALPVSSVLLPSTPSSNMFCPAPSTRTETVYQTITLSKKH
ncbi:unnamed protein product [Meganyctiphanes norvegica]|uniref:Uncharacterized protein n=1 Tax=Meganyctiphanes norvegica TaxID=48144 RepID=A0AAV2SGQ4_MEGNR